MLRSLYIRDYALIEELEVDFGGGLNIITGETGAGKSILIGALKMILGERASTDVVRSGAAKAVVEGVFDHVASPRVEDALRANQLDASDHIILRREISSSQSRAFVNDSPATLTVMRDIAAELIDLHGQHEHQSLLRTETHVELIDGFGGLGELVGTYRERHGELHALVSERDRLVGREQELSRQRELYEFQIEEIDRVDPKVDEEEELEQERRILENAEHLYEATASLYEMLYESDGALHDQLVGVRDALRDLARIDGAFDASTGEVESAQIVISELASFLQAYNSGIEFNPERLAFIRDRLGALELLKRKYGGTLESVRVYRDEIGEAHALAADFAGAIARITASIDEAEQALSAVAVELSDRRREVASSIEAAIVSELSRLGIGHARFEVHFEREEVVDGAVRTQDASGRERRYRARANGMDAIAFYLSTNVGESPRPLARVASGGEVSRVMLALKSVLARNERLPILIFDEIDTGVSGQVARKVGECMRDLARFHQIVAITHLPQIAAMGDNHFLVEKTVTEGRTSTSIRALDSDERTSQVAALLSGKEVTEAALESARQLISH